jgi:hypothetical protein
MDTRDVPANWETCTPSDTAFVDYVGFYVGTTGNVAAQTTAGTTVVFTAVPAGATIKGRFIRIMSTNTTASTILGAKAT